MIYRMRVLRAASIYGAWREPGDLLELRSDIAAAALAKSHRAEAADAETAERIGPLVQHASTRSLKRAAWSERQT